MTNKSLRERFKLAENQIHLVSQVITAAQDEGWIKPDQAVGSSKRFARYVPGWA
jgi:ATP-dependent DNA helicase RecG